MSKPGSQRWSQMICSGQAKNWTALQLTDVPWYNILSNSMESGDTQLCNYIASQEAKYMFAQAVKYKDVLNILTDT